jgi:hypothetical protein
MANVLTTGPGFCPDKKPSFFARLLRARIEARQSSITLPSTGINLRMTRSIKSSGRFFKSGRQR